MSTGIVSGFVKFVLHATLERLPNGHSGLRFQLVLLGLEDKISNLLLPFLYRFIDRCHRRKISEGIPNADAEAVVKKPVVDDAL